MNIVQTPYTPPRLLALILGVVIFVVYQVFRRPMLASDITQGDPVPLAVALVASVVVGYGLSMLWWLIRRTKGQFWYTFHPTRSRFIGAFCLAMIAPFAVFTYIPWIFGGLMFVILFEEPIWAIAITAMAITALYPLASMIVRHTYQRRWLRVGLFCLTFWTAYAGYLLFMGEVVFRL